MSEILHAFLNVTSFESGGTLGCFPTLFTDLCERSETCLVKNLTSEGWRKLNANGLMQIANGKRKSNWIQGTFTGPFDGSSHSKTVSGQVVWNSNAYCWNDIEPNVPNLQIEADQQLVRDRKSLQRWQALQVLKGAEGVRGLEPTVCFLVQQFASALNFDSAKQALVRLLEELSRHGVPNDLRVYGNFGPDALSDGGMNIVLRSRTDDKRRTGWRERFLRPKPLLAARSSVMKALHDSLGIELTPLNAKTIGGESIVVARLSDEDIARIPTSRAANLFVHQSVW